METSNKQQLSALYRRIKKEGCCCEWQNDRNSFYEWYENQLKKQKCLCYYCHLPGDTTRHYGHYFRPPCPPSEGKRGRSLEVDRIRCKEPYSPQNCVLACYPCNNAKSDVFSYEEFLKIGEAIRKAKTGTA